MKLKFCGAAGEVTGSAHLLTLNDGFTILLDCGLYQGHDAAWKDFNENWLFDPTTLDCMVLSHAHIDHTGRIPKLVKDGFKGNIYCTPATRSLSSLLLLDSARIQVNDAEYDNKKHNNNKSTPLYSEADAKIAINQFVTYGYENWFQIHPDVWVLFRDMGHILGSASVTLYVKEGEKIIRFGFTGDIGRPLRPILRDPQPMPPVDYLLAESTYGDKEHESAPDELAHFAQIIHDTIVEKKGKVIIPAFSVGRTQEIVYMLDRLVAAKELPEIPVYVDSPMSVNATQLFKQHLECYDDELHDYMLTDADPFGFNSLNYITSVEESKALNTNDLPCVIIASSGMMNTGRVKHHLANNVENAKNTILIVGYCSADTPGGELKNGATEIELFGKKLAVRARVEVMDSFSAHGDRKEMLDVLKNQIPTVQKTFLVHGDPEKQVLYKTFLQENGFGSIAIPTLGEEVTLV
jgi:metallo-beta-lactamase family protein